MPKLVIYFFISLLYHHASAQSVADVQLIPSSLDVHLSQFSLLLIAPANTNVSCSLVQAVTTGIAEQTVRNPPCLASNSTNISSTDNWMLLTSAFRFSAGVRSTFVRAVRRDSSPLLLELVVISCCNSDTAQHSSSRIFVDIEPNITFTTNYTLAFPNPAYLEIAQCQCDLTYGLCDINCCCDTECSTSYVSRFVCAQGYFGGNFTNDDPLFCNTTSLDVLPWHQFTCVVFPNSPFLGLYFTNAANSLQVLTSAVQIEAKVATQLTYSMRDSDTRTLPPSLLASYRNGDAIVFSNLSPEYTAFLTLAQVSLGGVCVRNSLIRYQHNSDAVCDVVVTSSLCVADSILDINRYLTAASMTLIANSSANQIQYQCLDFADYIRQNQPTGYNETRRSLFSNGTTTSTPTTCTSTPTIPTVSGSTCLSSVVDVAYTFTWRAGEITAISVVIGVADVPIISMGNESVLAQKFTASFTSNATNSSLTRSGNPGYNIGAPIVSALRITDTNFDTENGLGVWIPGSSDLCADSTSSSPLFGIDYSSGCLLRLAFSDFDDCNSLRLMVESQQRALVNVTTHVSRFGNPDQIDSDWITISQNFTEATNSTSTFLGQCDQIPATVLIEFVTSTSGQIDGFPIVEIVGARVSWERVAWNMTCAGSGTCEGNSSVVESFAVTTIVSFQSVDAVYQAPPTSFSLRDNETCARKSTCWPELLLPLTSTLYMWQPADFAERELEYNLVWTLILVIAGSAVTLLPLQWQKIGRFITRIAPL